LDYYRFNGTRLPTIPSDTAAKYPAHENNHVIFIRQNRLYEVPLVINGKELSTAEIEALIEQVVSSSAQSQKEHGTAPAVGTLTSENRDTWTKAREHLLSLGEVNKKTLQRIDSAIIVVPLDDISPSSREELSWGCWVGGGRNRWYDKHQCESYLHFSFPLFSFFIRDRD
jgi:carnitine O-acetyltransferase